MGTSKKQKKREWLRYRDFVLSPYGVIKIKSLGYIYLFNKAGQIINVTRVTISRILAHWQSEGLICRENKTIIVHHQLFDDVYDWLSYFSEK